MPAKSLKTQLQKGNTSMANQSNVVTPIHSGTIGVDGEVVQIQTLSIHQPALAQALLPMNERERSDRLTNVINLGQLIFEMSKDSKEVIQVQSLIGQLKLAKFTMMAKLSYKTFLTNMLMLMTLKDWPMSLRTKPSMLSGLLWILIMKRIH